MKKKTYGSYVILVADAEPTFVADFTRQMRITDEVLRFSVVKKDKFAPDFVRRTEERSTSRKSREESSEGAAGKSKAAKPVEGTTAEKDAVKLAAAEPVVEKEATVESPSS